jgi:altronate dehydratase
MTQRIAVQINPADNVVTVVEDALPGDTALYVTPQGSREIALVEAVPFGHKVALRDVRPGETILKYNEAIGTASKAIGQGQHVHTHNVHSAVQGAAK